MTRQLKLETGQLKLEVGQLKLKSSARNTQKADGALSPKVALRQKRTRIFFLYGRVVVRPRGAAQLGPSSPIPLPPPNCAILMSNMDIFIVVVVV